MHSATERYVFPQVFFTCANGSLFALCPVAPFQAKVSVPAVEHLHSSNMQQPDAASASTTQAWLDQVLPLHSCKLCYLLHQHLHPRLGLIRCSLDSRKLQSTCKVKNMQQPDAASASTTKAWFDQVLKTPPLLQAKHLVKTHACVMARYQASSLQCPSHHCMVFVMALIMLAYLQVLMLQSGTAVKSAVALLSKSSRSV